MWDVGASLYVWENAGQYPLAVWCARPVSLNGGRGSHHADYVHEDWLCFSRCCKEGCVRGGYEDGMIAFGGRLEKEAKVGTSGREHCLWLPTAGGTRA